MPFHKTEITWSEGEYIHQREQEKELQNQLDKLEEFLTSTCDLFSFADWCYYAEETGKDIDWLRAHAKYSDPDGAHGAMLNNAIIDGDSDLAEFFI